MFKKFLMAMDYLFFASNPYSGVLTANQIAAKAAAIKERNMARIIETNGQYVLNFGDTIVGTYSRARDARRGATRRGLVVA